MMKQLAKFITFYYTPYTQTYLIIISEYTHSFLSYLFTEVRPFEGDHADVDGVGDKGLIVHELVGSEGGDCVEEELSSLFEVPDGHAVQALVDFQTIPPVPVSPLLNEAVETGVVR